MIGKIPNRNQERGVTIIELMVTIVVLAILAAIAYPDFTRMLERRRMVGAAENIFALLQYAKTESIKRNRVVNVQFDDAIWCLGLDDTPASACDCDAAPGNCTVNGLQKTLFGSDYKDIDLTITNFTGSDFDFDPRIGNVDDDGEFQVTTPHGKSRCVELNLLGRVKMKDGAC